MEYYHKGLKYHEDKTEKHRITQDEVQFLCNLQKEMNTQELIGKITAEMIESNPKYKHLKD